MISCCQIIEIFICQFLYARFIFHLLTFLIIIKIASYKVLKKSIKYYINIFNISVIACVNALSLIALLLYITLKKSGFLYFYERNLYFYSARINQIDQM